MRRVRCCVSDGGGSSIDIAISTSIMVITIIIISSFQTKLLNSMCYSFANQSNRVFLRKRGDHFPG